MDSAGAAISGFIRSSPIVGPLLLKEAIPEPVAVADAKVIAFFASALLSNEYAPPSPPGGNNIEKSGLSHMYAHDTV